MAFVADPFVADPFVVGPFVVDPSGSGASPLAVPEGTTTKCIDFDTHGLVGIRLIEPTPHDVLAVTKQLGPLQAELKRKPDITIRFVPALPLTNLRHVVRNQNGFTDDAFFILRSKKRPAKVKFDFSRIGQELEIVCESGLAAVPLLTATIILTLLQKGHVALHASAFQYGGAGILVTGWAKGGKTEALLAFARHGAQYLGDEWIILSGDGQRMYGLPEDIRLWDWHLEYLPNLRRHLKRDSRWLFRGVHGLERMQCALNGHWWNSFPLKLVEEAMPALKRQLNVTMPPAKVFDSIVEGYRGRPDKVFFMISHADPDIRVESVDPLAIVERMIHSLRYELWPFMEHYLAFRYAFPDRRSELVERSAELQFDLLRSALRGKEAYTVRHPYPVNLEELWRSMGPLCDMPALLPQHITGRNRSEYFEPLLDGA